MEETAGKQKRPINYLEQWLLQILFFLKKKKKKVRFFSLAISSGL